jgi:signal transduction histidine kinase
VARRRTDLLLAAAGAAFGAASLAAQDYGAVAIASGAVLGSALGAARPHPREAWLVAVAALVAMAPFVGEVPLGTVFLVPAIAFCVGRWDGRWSGLVGLLCLIAAGELVVALSHDAFVPVILIPATAWGAGRALRERERVADQLAERARELEEEREAHARLSVRYERARIASELHDIVAHAISVMVVQASAGQRLAAHDPKATAETFDAIAEAAHQAEQDMGRLVALLGDEGAISPAPDLALVEELVARAAGSGLDVTLRLEGEREGLPAPVVETAYRVVQEGLTNALRYAAGTAVRVLVRGDREALLVEVQNAQAASEGALAGVGTGTGLQGLRERVATCGGTLSAGATLGGGWRLSARLPRRVAAGAG